MQRFQPVAPRHCCCKSICSDLCGLSLWLKFSQHSILATLRFPLTVCSENRQFSDSHAQQVCDYWWPAFVEWLIQLDAASCLGVSNALIGNAVEDELLHMAENMSLPRPLLSSIPMLCLQEQWECGCAKYAAPGQGLFWVLWFLVAAIHFSLNLMSGLGLEHPSS